MRITQYVRKPVFCTFLQACIEKQAVFFPFVEVETVRLYLRGEINKLTRYFIKVLKIMRT